MFNRYKIETFIWTFMFCSSFYSTACKLFLVRSGPLLAQRCDARPYADRMSNFERQFTPQTLNAQTWDLAQWLHRINLELALGLGLGFGCFGFSAFFRPPKVAHRSKFERTEILPSPIFCPTGVVADSAYFFWFGEFEVGENYLYFLISFNFV